MKNLLALLGLTVVVLVGLGWYLGWYKLSITKQSDGTLQVQGNVDTNKAGTDFGKGFKVVEGFVENQIDKTSTTGTPAAPTSASAPLTQPTSTTPQPTPLKETSGWLFNNILGGQQH